MQTKKWKMQEVVENSTIRNEGGKNIYKKTILYRQMHVIYTNLN